jgi:hypothetical protein
LASLGLIVIIVVALLAHYLSSGTITITTNSKDNTITLQKVSGNGSFVKTAIGTLSSGVGHGLYTATVKNGSQVSTQVINFNEGHKTLHYYVSLGKLIDTEPVSYQEAKDVVADNNQLLYINPDGNLYKIDSSNNDSSVSLEDLETVEWVNTSFGVGQDQFGNLYTVINGVVHALIVPFSYTGKSVNFAVAPDKQIYISNGSTVYAGNQSGSFKKIYTASSSSPVLAAGNNYVAVSDTKNGAHANNIPSPLLSTVSSSGAINKKSIEAEQLSWSPNSKYLAEVNEASPTIYNSSLKEIATVPTSSSVSQLKWLNNNTLIFATDDEVWSYSLSTQSLKLMAITYNGSSVTDLALSDDKSYIYLVTYDSSSKNYAIGRLNLEGQSVSSSISQLWGILLSSANNYSLNMINFKQPAVILVQPLPSAPSANYAQMASTDLSGGGFDVSGLQFRVVSVPSSEQ